MTTSAYGTPSATAWQRVKRLTEQQWKAFKEIDAGAADRLLIQAPSGSGKTVLCVKLALRFLATRLQLDADEGGANPCAIGRPFRLCHRLLFHCRSAPTCPLLHQR